MFINVLFSFITDTLLNSRKVTPFVYVYKVNTATAHVCLTLSLSQMNAYCTVRIYTLDALRSLKITQCLFIQPLIEYFCIAHLVCCQISLVI